MAKGICTECDDPVFTRNSRGYCCRHFRRWQRYGDPHAGGPLVKRTKRLPHSSTDAERFWAKVDTSGDCWVWLGALNEQGYGVVIRGRKWVGARREHLCAAADRRTVLSVVRTDPYICLQGAKACPGGRLAGGGWSRQW